MWVLYLLLAPNYLRIWCASCHISFFFLLSAGFDWFDFSLNVGWIFYCSCALYNSYTLQYDFLSCLRIVLHFILDIPGTISGMMKAYAFYTPAYFEKIFGMTPLLASSALWNSSSYMWCSNNHATVHECFYFDYFFIVVFRF